MLMRMLDDHDSLWDNALGSGKWPLWQQVLQAYQEYHPVPANNGLPDGGMWQLTRFGRVAIMGLDLRSQRTSPGSSACPITTCSILGAAQREWVVDTLTQLQADPTVSWIVVVSSVPFNPRQLKPDSWSGYNQDRLWFKASVEALGLTDRVLIVSGDCHYGSIVVRGQLSPLTEISIPRLNAGFGNTCSNWDSQWTLNLSYSRPGFGLLTLTPTSATIDVHNEMGQVETSRTGLPMSHTVNLR